LGCRTTYVAPQSTNDGNLKTSSAPNNTDRLRAGPPHLNNSAELAPSVQRMPPLNPQPSTLNPQPSTLSPQTPHPLLLSSADNAANLSQYTVDFTRYEHRGLLFKKLHGPERIRAWFRKSPRAIRLEWLDNDVKYGDAVYCETTDPRRVRFQPRIWLPPLVPGVNTMAIQTPVTLGEALHPITDFGVDEIMQRVLRDIRESPAPVEIRDDGPQPAAHLSRQAHRFTLRFSPSETETPTRHLFIDRQTNLPVAVELFDADGDLFAAYYYDNLTPTTALTDDDFLLECERSRQKPPKSPPPHPSQ
ncbi:MAG: DUF1571 domain-containing protein, partial [Phycisphaerae bacterium]